MFVFFQTKRMMFSFIAVAAMVFVFSFSHISYAQTSLDLSAGGSVTLGFDSGTCNSANQGAIRYNSTGSNNGPTGCPNIGDTCSDGSIYAGLSPDGNEPMYTTPADAPSTYIWSSTSADTMTDCNDTSPGTALTCRTGAANTVTLTARPPIESYPASDYCDALSAHSQSDWYLPASDELNVLYTNHVAIGGFDTSGNRYWTSSEDDNTNARRQRFDTGGQSRTTKNTAHIVRCVRKGSGPVSGAIQIYKPDGSSCPNIGDTCSDGSIYAGLSPDGNVSMYTTPANAGGIPWNNGNSSGVVNLYTPITQSFVGGEASTAAFIGVDSDSSTGGVQPFQAPEYCYNLTAHGHSDWYVPSENEFEVLRTNYVAIGVPNGNYWTSTEVCCDAMFYRSIPSGGGSGIKRFSNIVRCVRKGTPHSWSNWGE